MTNKTTMLLAFIAGAIIGAALVWLSCNYCCKSSCCPGECAITPDTTGIQHISLQQANAFSREYMSHPDTVKGLRAFSINQDQFAAMQVIAQGDSTVHGFRIYMGRDSGKPVRMVVGTGSPDKVAHIYVTSDEDSGPCPDVCDDSNQIFDR